MQIESKDHALLDLLQKDTRLSNAEMAQQLGLSASACWRRVRALEDAGVIKRYAAVVDPAALGLRFEAIVQVHLARHEAENVSHFVKAIGRRDEIIECYATTGQADYHLRVVCRDIEAYNAFLEEFLFRVPGIASAQTNVILRKFKSDTPLRGGTV